jgi:hypothetical protein
LTLEHKSPLPLDLGPQALEEGTHGAVPPLCQEAPGAGVQARLDLAQLE